MAMPVTATPVTVAAAHTVTCRFAITVPAAHTVTCQFAITVAAAHTVTWVTIVHTTGVTVTPVIVVLTMAVTDTPCTTAHITGLMDTHHSFRGIGFIDRFTLTQVTCPAIAPLVTQRTGVDVRCA